MADDDPVIAYSVRELLTKMDGKLDAIGTQLGSKADTTHVDQLAASVGDLNGRVTSIEEDRKRQAATATSRLANRQWLVPTICGAIVAAIEILQSLHIHA